MNTLPSAGYFAALPFRAKLNALTAATVAIALLFSCVGLIALQYRNDQQATQRRHKQIANVLSANIGAAIVFGDKQAAQENIRSVAQVGDIYSVRVYDNEGRKFVEYVKNTPDHSPDHEESQVKQPILIDGDRVGELRMDVHPQTFWDIVRDTAFTAFILFLACIAIALAFSRWLGKTAIRPIDRLIDAMEKISHSGDFSVRVDAEPDPDFNIIVKSFNGMLNEVESRKDQLSQSAIELTYARDEAQQANIAKSQFLANMSHELRTPLNAIIGYTEVLKDELEAANMERSVDDLQWIYGSAKQLLGLINGILDLSKIEAGRMELDMHEFEVAEMLREVVAMLEPIAAQKNNSLHIQIDPTVSTAHTDSTKLRQCLLNLVSNACKFTEDGHVVITARVDGEHLIFAVSDTGIGMTDDQLERLFQPFVQADASTTRRFGGTGLGLTISGRFAEMLHGSISVESSPGVGSTFTLSVIANLQNVNSLVENDTLLPMAASPRAHRDGSRPLALIVDDEPSSLQLLTRIAEQAGYQVSMAIDGERGLSAARKEQPDLILLDIGMPKVDGWEVLDALGKETDLRSIPTVVVTVDDDRRRALAAGASDHLVKPINRDELIDVLKLYCDRQIGRVLVVDDDPATAALYARGIIQIGYEAETVSNGKEAIAAIKKSNFDFIVTDLKMPGGDGFQLVDEIGLLDLKRKPHIFVVTGMPLESSDKARLDGKVFKLIPKNGLSPRKLALDLNSAARHFAAAADGIAGEAA
jgi:signal transduction histidine kinase/DNA-binding response OmpR family regulator